MASYRSSIQSIFNGQWPKRLSSYCKLFFFLVLLYNCPSGPFAPIFSPPSPQVDPEVLGTQRASRPSVNRERNLSGRAKQHSTGSNTSTVPLKALVQLFFCLKKPDTINSQIGQLAIYAMLISPSSLFALEKSTGLF